MITTIIFDLSEVYLQGIIGSETYLQEKLGVPVSPTYFYTPYLDQLFLGKITEKTFWERMIEKHSWNIPVDDLKQAVRKNFKEIKGTREIIEQLKKKGYRLGLLSNHAKEWIAYCVFLIVENLTRHSKMLIEKPYQVARSVRTFAN